MHHTPMPVGEEEALLSGIRETEKPSTLAEPKSEDDKSAQQAVNAGSGFSGMPWSCTINSGSSPASPGC